MRELGRVNERLQVCDKILIWQFHAEASLNVPLSIA